MLKLPGGLIVPALLEADDAEVVMGRAIEDVRLCRLPEERLGLVKVVFSRQALTVQIDGPGSIWPVAVMRCQLCWAPMTMGGASDQAETASNKNRE